MKTKIFSSILEVRVNSKISTLIPKVGLFGILESKTNIQCFEFNSKLFGNLRFDYLSGSQIKCNSIPSLMFLSKVQNISVV